MEPINETDNPQDLLSDISHEIMKDRVTAADSHTFDRENISLINEGKIPRTNLRLWESKNKNCKCLCSWKKLSIIYD